MANERTPSEPSFEEYPLSRNEYISAMVHFYRGEMNRANTWRNRLDTTTNWAVVATAAILSFAFSQGQHSHVSLLLANLLVLNFLALEARRFRYFDVWRSRIRMIEENFFLPIIRRNLVSPRNDWREFVAEDLDHPTFKITYLQAISMRLRRNYLGIFAIILVAWFAKLLIHPADEQVGSVISRMGVGVLPGWLVLAFVTTFSVGLVALAVWGKRERVSSDEVHGVEKSIDHWKT